MIEVLQRETWHGEPNELGDLFRLTKARRHARATLYTHIFGWEAKLFVGASEEPVQTQVCRSQEEVLATGERWRAALEAKGWA